MKRFIINGAIFSIPFGIYCLLIALIDPFNYLNHSQFFSQKEKEAIVQDIEPHLFKMIAFQNKPKKNWVIGDSRTNGLYEVMDKNSWSNLAYGGASLKEMIQSFWWASSLSTPDTVLMGINLSLYNKYNKRFWVEETISRKSNYFSYAFNNYTFKAAFKLALPEKQLSDTAYRDDEADAKKYFWQQKLKGVDKFYGKMAYPDEYFSQLTEISAYCQRRDIKLIFWIPPIHEDYQQLVDQYDLDEYNDRFLKDLRRLGDVFDFNENSSLTKDKDNFRDPVHFTTEIARKIEKEIRSYSPKNAVLYREFSPGISSY
ncbi:hypothetical protein SAMN04488057_101121 [Cyclobacterium lianum]|uniref:DUF1574 domain-containing protein n=1 Tax=Cyclobacterium lianum TaxID=388280 RepID=A0A1M7HZ04_9BACT|nr:hypothetical protein [Cyclobacterium lianum]SHM33752.1 hypothetical protein SAMN04488057_101121 [Cyclobacterium lianum]